MTATLIFYVLVAVLAVWVYRDADGFDWPESQWIPNTPGNWAWSAFFVWPIFLPLYLWRRRSAQSWDEMTCPECAETVKQEAAVCRYCGYRFAETELNPPRQAVPARQPSRRT